MEINNLEKKLMRREARKNTDNLIPDLVEEEATATKSSLFKRK